MEEEKEDLGPFEEPEEPQEAPQRTAQPYETLVQMRDIGASNRDMVAYINQHPDAMRGAEASRIVRNILQHSTVAQQIDFIRKHPSVISSGYGTTYATEEQKKIVEDIQTQLKEYGRLEGEEQFKKAVELGFIPEGSKYVEGVKPAGAEVLAFMEEQGASQKEIKAAKQGTTAGYYTAEQIKEIQEATQQRKEWASEVVEAGKEYKVQVAEFEAAHTKLPDNQWIDNKQLTEIKATSPDIYKALTTQGFGAADKIIQAADKIIQEQNTALDKLKGYKVQPYSTATMYEAVKAGLYTVPEIAAKREAESGFNITKYLTEHPDDTATLAQAGFSPESIIEANTLSQINLTGGQTSPNDYFSLLPTGDKVSVLQAGQLISQRIGWSPQMMFSSSAIPDNIQQELKEQYNLKTLNDFKKLPEATQQAITDKVWNSLSDASQAELLKTVARGEAYERIAQSVALGAIPIAGTVIYWNEMPTWAKVVSIAGDVLFFSALLKINPIRWIAPGLYDKSERAITVYNRVTASTVDDALSQLGGVSDDLLKGAQRTATAATNYADDFSRLKMLEIAVEESKNILKGRTLVRGTAQFQAVADYYADSFRALRQATKATELSRVNLLKLAGQYTDDIIERLDPPLSFRSTLEDIPTELLRRVETLASPTATPLSPTALKVQILTKEGEIARLATKTGQTATAQQTNLTKIQGLSQELAELKAQLLRAQVMDIQQLESQLRAVKDVLPGFEKQLSSLNRGTKQYDELLLEIQRLRQAEKVLPDQISKAYKTLEIEWASGSIWGGTGNIATIAPTGTMGLVSGGVTTVELTKTGVLPFSLAYSAAAIPIFTGGTKAQPVTPIPSIVTNPITKTGITIAPSDAPSPGMSPAPGEVTKPAVTTAPEVSTVVGPGSAESISQDIQPAPAPVPSPEPAPKPETKTVTTTATTTKKPPAPKEPPVPPLKPIIPLVEEAAEEEKIYPPGTVAWKQGIGWWVIQPPYTTKGSRSFSLTKPKGATITSDVNSAAATIQSYGGKPPKSFKFDMGFIDVHIKEPPSRPSRDAGRKAITFKRDTEGTYGGTGKARKVGPYYHKAGMVSRHRL